MKNIFENAYFGKAYRTREGRKALYHNIISTEEGTKHYLITISSGFICDNDGKSPCKDDSIISEWREEVNEEELDKITKETLKRIMPTDYGDGYNQTLASIFKIGFRKALEMIKNQEI